MVLAALPRFEDSDQVSTTRIFSKGTLRSRGAVCSSLQSWSCLRRGIRGHGHAHFRDAGVASPSDVQRGEERTHQRAVSGPDPGRTWLYDGPGKLAFLRSLDESSNLRDLAPQFIDMCILLGCDYCDSIKGIGPKKAYELVKEHKNIETIIKKLDPKKYPVPEDWPYKEAKELFRNPDVLDASKVEVGARDGRLLIARADADLCLSSVEMDGPG